MRLNVAIVAGTLIGATAGVLCLCFAGTPARPARVETIRPSTSVKGRTQVEVEAPAKVRRETPKPYVKITPTVAKAPAPKPAEVRPALPGSFEIAMATAPKAAAVASPEDASFAGKRQGPITNAVQNGISGFQDGLDLSRPVALAGPTSRAPLSHGAALNFAR